MYLSKGNNSTSFRFLICVKYQTVVLRESQVLKRLACEMAVGLLLLASTEPNTCVGVRHLFESLQVQRPFSLITFIDRLIVGLFPKLQFSFLGIN